MELWLSFVLGAVAVWRITHLFHAEDGPWDILVHFRRLLGNSIFGQAADCFYCLSLWIALPFAIMFGHNFGEQFLLWWAFSGAAILLERFSERKKPFVQPNQFEEK
jgi:hypothetical protein